MEILTTEPVAMGYMKSSPAPGEWAVGDQAMRKGPCTALQRLPEWSPVMERPMITISGDPSCRLKPMKPLARRTRRALRLSVPFLAGHKQQGSPSGPILPLDCPVPCRPLTCRTAPPAPPPARSPPARPGQRWRRSGSRGGSGGRRPARAHSAGTMWHCRKPLCAVGQRETHRHQMRWKKGEDREERPHREKHRGFNSMAGDAGQDVMTGMCWSGCSGSLSTTGV